MKCKSAEKKVEKRTLFAFIDEEKDNADVEELNVWNMFNAPPPLFWRGGREVRLVE